MNRYYGVWTEYTTPNLITYKVAYNIISVSNIHLNVIVELKCNLYMPIEIAFSKYTCSLLSWKLKGCSWFGWGRLSLAALADSTCVLLLTIISTATILEILLIYTEPRWGHEWKDFLVISFLRDYFLVISLLRLSDVCYYDLVTSLNRYYDIPTCFFEIIFWWSRFFEIIFWWSRYYDLVTSLSRNNKRH